MLEKEEFGVSRGEEAEVKQAAQGGLAEVMSVLVAVFRQADFS